MFFFDVLEITTSNFKKQQKIIEYKNDYVIRVCVGE